ncbi:MAG: HlyD family type I secretion periplasmic adaptor subunit [Pararhodobacter sp.]
MMDDLPELKAGGPLALGLGSTLVMLVGLLGWAAQAAITSAVVAMGEVNVAPYRHPVQHPEGGVISEVLVQDGQQVSAGELLMRIDGSVLQTEIDFVQTQIAEGEARQVRFRAERDGTDFPPLPANVTMGPELLRALGAQLRLYDARRDTYERQQAQLLQRRRQAEASLDSLILQRAQMEEEFAILGAELQNQQALRDQGLTVSTRVSELARDYARLAGSRAALEGRDNELRSQITEIILQSESLQAQRREEAEVGFAETSLQLIELRVRRAALQARLRRLDLRAPAGGVVHAMAITAPDSVLRPVDVVMQIVAPPSAPVLTLRVNPDEIEHVFLGQPTMLRFPGLASRNLADLPGRVTNISAATFVDERSGLRHFRVDVVPDPDSMQALGPRALVPGMSVQAFITTGVRTPLDYMLDPVRDHFARALREP